MRIGIDARLWNQTGVGRYIRNLISELQIIDKQNNYILFVINEDYKDVKSRISNLKLQHRWKIINCNIRWHTIAEQTLLPKILNNQNLDLLHFPYYSVPIFYKKPFVVTIHDLIPLHFSTGKASTLPFPLYKIKFLSFEFIVLQAAKNARKIIAPSNFSKDEIIQLLNVPNSKVKVIYEGTDEFLNSYAHQEKENYLYIGNAYPHKNLELLIDVFKNLPNIKLILVGKDDFFYKRLKKKAGKATNIKFFGYASDSQLKDLYSKAKALIIPSLIEGFGLPALEAMANRCLVLASDIPVLHEVCGDAALYFHPKDTDSLKSLIEKVHFNTASYRSKIELGLKRVKEFSWEKTAKETLELYESCDSLR